MITRIVIEAEGWNQEDVVAEILKVSSELRSFFSEQEPYSADDIFPRDKEVVRDVIEGKQPGFYRGKRTMLNEARLDWHEFASQPVADDHREDIGRGGMG